MRRLLQILAAFAILVALLPIARSQPPAHPPGLDPRWHDEVTPEGQRARGLYLGASFVHRNGAQGVIDLVHSARLNAVVIDLKDGEGQVHYDSAIPELQDAETGQLGDARAVVAQIKAAGIYTIARVVCFADRHLPARMPERAIQDRRPFRHGAPWVSWGTGGTWLDPYQEANQDMVLAIAREAQDLGFDEVQLDYVRFPVDDGVQLAHYPGETNTPRPQVILRMLRNIDEALHIPLGVDVFGLTAFRAADDPSHLGQNLEVWTTHVEVFTPMLYLNSMREWDVGRPNRSFTLVLAGVTSLRERLGPGPVIRPFLQGFREGSDHFDAAFIADQIRAARRGHADGFLFWNPSHRYGTVRSAMRSSARYLAPFPFPEERARLASVGTATPDHE